MHTSRITCCCVLQSAWMQCACDNFLSGWCADDVMALLAICSEVKKASAGIRAAHAWVQHDAEGRGQHWAGMVQGVDLSPLSKAEMVSLRSDIDDPVLIRQLFDAAVAKLP